MKKGFVIIPILIVFLLIGIVLIFILKNNTPVQKIPSTVTTPTPATLPMSNWKTYTNEYYRYTLNYPPTLYIAPSTPSEPSSGIVDIPTFVLENEIDLEEAGITARTLVIGIFVVEESSLEAEIENLPKTDIPNSKRNKIDINGKDAFRLEAIVKGNPLFGIITFIESDGNIFKISLSSPNIDQDTINMYDQMVSTFEFSQ